MNSKLDIPYFSVIIPTYNRETFVLDAIKSVLNQTYKDFELLIVDDASTDSSPLLLEKLCKTNVNIRILTNSENKGVSYSRNLGIKNAMGQYITFLDSDDIWLKNKLLKQYNFFNNNPTIKFVHSNEKWLKNGEHFNQKKQHKKFGGFIFEKLLDTCIISPSTVAMHRSLFDDVGLFDTDLEVCEDYDLWLRVQLEYELGFIEEELIIKRGGHQDQLSTSHAFMDMYRIKSLFKNLDIIKDISMQKSVKEKIKQKLTYLYQGAQKHNNPILIDFCQNILQKIEH